MAATDITATTEIMAATAAITAAMAARSARLRIAHRGHPVISRRLMPGFEPHFLASSSARSASTLTGRGTTRARRVPGAVVCAVQEGRSNHVY